MTNGLALLAHWSVRQKLNCRQFSSDQLRRSVRALNILVVYGSYSGGAE